MLRLGVFVLSVVCCIAGLWRSADAAVTATFSIVGPNPVTANCPVNVNFTGTISGPPGTNVMYIFSHFTTGPAVTGPFSGTIPASGTLPISETVNVDAAHSGFQSNEVDVTAPNTAQGKVYFTVNCSPITVSTPTPHPNQYNLSGHTAVQGVMAVPYPDGVTNVESAKVCGDHGGLAGLFCPQALHDGYLILVWNWAGNSFHPKADGFRVYRVDGGQHTLVDTQTNPQATISFQKPIAGGFGGKCYGVTAYQGSSESRLSPTFCVAAGYTGRQSKNVSVSNWAWHYHQYVSCGVSAGICVTGVRCDHACLGWAHHDSGANASLDHVNTWWRSYIQFDPNQIAGLNVFKATLTMRVLDGDPNCFGALGAAQGQSWNTQDVPDGDWEDVPHSMSSSGATFDVTDIVRDWARGATPNWGFAFKGNNEDTGAENNGQCMLDFDQNASLNIEYY